jgi:hypothetical protein
MHNTERHNVKPKLGATHRKRGGMVYEGADSNVVKEAEKRKSGGKVYEGAGSNVVKEAEKRKHGGHVKKHHMKVGGHAAKHNLAHRKHGGHVKHHASGGKALASYSVHHPLSSAHNVKQRSDKEDG